MSNRALNIMCVAKQRCGCEQRTFATSFNCSACHQVAMISDCCHHLWSASDAAELTGTCAARWLRLLGPQSALIATGVVCITIVVFKRFFRLNVYYHRHHLLQDNSDEYWSFIYSFINRKTNKTGDNWWTGPTRLIMLIMSTYSGPLLRHTRKLQTTTRQKLQATGYWQSISDKQCPHHPVMAVLSHVGIGRPTM